MCRLGLALTIILTLLAHRSYAGSCCSTGCPDIMPCPPSEPIRRETCDPSNRIHEVTGYFEYWAEFMRVSRVCEYEPYQFEAMIFDEESYFDPNANDFKGLKKIISQPWWAWTIVTSKSLGNHTKWWDRKFTATGCFINDHFFLADTVRPWRVPR